MVHKPLSLTQALFPGLDYSPWNYTPPKINIEPENDGLVQMFLLFQGARIVRFQPFIFPGCNSKLDPYTIVIGSVIGFESWLNP